MTNLTLFKALVEILAVVAVCVGFYYEEKFVKLERKVFVFLKCFFKALFFTIKEKTNNNKNGTVISINCNNSNCNDKQNSENNSVRIA